jgi:hypothetical protein
VLNGLTKGLSVALLVLTSGSNLFAQTALATKTLHAQRISVPVRVDGVLDDESWQQAEAASDFVQQDPNVGEPASEPTEVRVLVDDTAIYFGIVCRDRDPHGVIARELRRGNPFASDDHFEILLDTFHDHRNAYHFAVNPLGTQYDALITDEGHDINAEWNERWWSETRITADGWTAEIKIPLTTLRSNADLDTFGLNFKRYVRRKNESAHWTGWSRDCPFLQVSQAGHLAGVEELTTGLKLRVQLYGLGGFRDATSQTDQLRDIGLEIARVRVTQGLTAEITVNTDFAQTEVDDSIRRRSRRRSDATSAIAR